MTTRSSISSTREGGPLPGRGTGAGGCLLSRGRSPAGAARGPPPSHPSQARGGPPEAASSGRAATAAQIPLELAGDLVAVGLGEVALGGPLLERAHVLDDLGVLVGHLVDGPHPVVGLLRQRAERHVELEDLLDPLQQRDRRPGGRRLRHVVRDGGPEADRRQPGLHAGVLEDAEDAGGPLVAGGLQPPLLGRLGVVGRAADRGRPGVRGVGEQGAEADHGARVELLAQLDQLLAEAAPAHVGLDAADQDDVPVGARRAGHRDAGGGPLDPAADPADERDGGPVDLEVVVVLGVERGERGGVPDELEVLQRPRGGVPGVVPALEGDDHHRVVEPGQVLRGGLRVDHPWEPTSIGLPGRGSRAARRHRRPPRGRPASPRGGYPGAVQSRLESPALRPDATAELTAEMGRRILVLDGAMGTAIQRDRPDEAGYRGERFADWPTDVQGNNDLLSLTAPEIITAIHREYLEAGADLIETNTFNATRISLADYGMSHLAYEINVASARLARAECDAATARTPDKPRYVVGAIGPTSRTASISPDVNDPGARNVSYDELVEAYLEQADGLVDGGADVLLIETVFDTLNAKAAIFALETLFEERGRRSEEHTSELQSRQYLVCRLLLEKKK